jgi:hypothetical protein
MYRRACLLVLCLACVRPFSPPPPLDQPDARAADAPMVAPPPPPRDASLPDAARPEVRVEGDGPSPIVPDAAIERPVTGVETRPVVSVRVADYQLLVSRKNADGSVATAPYDIRGISWSPAQKGAGKPGPSAYTDAADVDLPLMRAANINTVKTYGPVERVVLDKALANGILAVVTVVIAGGDDHAAVVTALRAHPGVLMWVVGNEWNRNNLFGGCAGDACYTRVNDIAREIKALDPNHPVATSFAPNGNVPTDADLRRLDAVDVWGLNVYSQPGFFNRFVDWRLAMERVGIKKPFFMSEYGGDAYDNRAGRADENAQAAALRQQTSEIRGQLSARNAALPCLGGAPFEWNDEWWKFGSWTVQDRGGFANGGVAPDSFANEDWWGIVDVDRRPRAAYFTLQELYGK